MHIVTLPFFDTTGELSPFIHAALEAGAKSANDPTAPHERITLTFSKAADAKAFESKVKAILKPVENDPVDAPTDTPAED